MDVRKESEWLGVMVRREEPQWRFPRHLVKWHESSEAGRGGTGESQSGDGRGTGCWSPTYKS